MSLIAGNLGVVQRLLDEAQLPWAICAGVAAHLYGTRRPIQDVDILVASGKLPVVVQLLQSAQKAVQFDGQRILWRGIKVIDDLTVHKPGRVHPFQLDTPMSERLRRLPLLGCLATVMAPEDVVVHKLLLDRGPEQGKHDREDVQGVVRRQVLDQDYLRMRMHRARAEQILLPYLAELGVSLDPVMAY